MLFLAKMYHKPFDGRASGLAALRTLN